MADAPLSPEQLVSAALAALQGGDGVDAQAVHNELADIAKELARALPVRESIYDPDLNGPAMSPEEIKAAAVAAREFLELIADLLGGPDDPDWMGDDFAFSAALKRRPDWKPPAPPTAAQCKRLAVAERVYELMAAMRFDFGQPPKQEAAIASVVQEFGLARSKVMQGLKEYRESWSWLASWSPDYDGELRLPTVRAQAKITHWMLENRAMAKEWLRRNPNAQFLWVPAGSALEKEWLNCQSPRDK